MTELGFRGNVNLKRSGTQIEWTEELIQEYLKCKEDPIYFAEKYVKIITEDGLTPIILRDYQKELILSMHNNRNTYALQARQSGKTEAVRCFTLHYALFNDFKTIAILADKQSTAKEILYKIQIAYQALPKWLQSGIKEFNKESFLLENGSRILVAGTSSNSIRGYTIHCVTSDTVITLRDKNTGFINILTMEELAYHIKEKERMYGFIYLTENIINGKKYIGKRKCKNEKLDSEYLGSGKILIKSIKKYGKENFRQTIIEYGNNDKELYELEKYYIKKYNCVEDNNYYNLCPGGPNAILLGEKNGFYNKTHTDKQIEKWKLERKGLPRTEESNNKRSETMKKIWSDPDFYDRMSVIRKNQDHTWTEERKLVLSKIMKGKRLSEETKQILSDIMIERWADPEKRKIIMTAFEKRDFSWWDTEAGEVMKQVKREQRINYNKSKEKRELTSKTQLGKLFSEERKNNISKGIRRRQEKIKNGEIIAKPCWNKGLSKETDERVLKYTQTRMNKNDSDIH